MKTINLREIEGQGYWVGNPANPYWEHHPCRYQLYIGSRNSKKSTKKIGIELIYRLISNPLRNGVVIRQNDVDNTGSTISKLKKIVSIMGLEKEIEFHVNPREMVYKRTGQRVRFKGFNNPTGLTSMDFPVGYLTDVYFEEASEISNYDDFRALDGSLRGDLPKECNMRIVLCMNPWNKQHWIYEKMYKGRLSDSYDELENAKDGYIDVYDAEFQLGYGKGLYIHQSTYRVNEFRSPDYDEGMEYLKKTAPEIYKVEGLGMWGNNTERVYPEFVRARNVILEEEAMKMRYGGFAIGIDTGYSNGEGRKRKDGAIKSATVVELTGVTSDYSKLIGIDEWYHSNDGLLIPMTLDEEVRQIVLTIKGWRDMIYRYHPDLMKGLIPVYIDNADIGFKDVFIKECQRQGLFDCYACGSTKMSIQSRVDFERWLFGYGECLISSKCSNLIREIEASRRGSKGETRENLNDHALNSWEYGWYPLKDGMMRWKNFKKR